MTWAEVLQQDWDEQDERAENGCCPFCGGAEFNELGSLGAKFWMRCRRCGVDVSISRREAR